MFILYVIFINFLFSNSSIGAQNAHVATYSVNLNKTRNTLLNKDSSGITEYTLPDLHANSIKFLKALVTLKCVRVSKKNVSAILAYYNANQHNISSHQLDRMKRAICSIRVTKKGKNALFRLIGDEVSDRGNNDYYTLLMIEHFSRNGMNIEFIISNHGYDFIRAYEDQTFYPSIGVIQRLKTPLFQQVMTPGWA
ncbi:MAG: hypothetical protein CNLJKLNK_00293 [Holosporales bacterium]